uniref:T9SS type A sorting domain-containing protein n=1 Tax=candidate division WOR-3 bacterium TaxID=2052148 RepID=A0A7C6A855_UNCW3
MSEVLLAQNQEWVARYNGPGNADDYSNAIAVDNSGNVYVTGRSEDLDHDYDYATIKYSSVGIEERNEKVKELTRNLKTIYSNLSKIEAVDLKIYNTLGSVVYSAKGDKGFGKINLPAGVYLVQIETKDKKEARKIIVVK